MHYVSFHVNSVISELGTGRSRRLTFRKLTRYVSFHVDSVIIKLGTGRNSRHTFRKSTRYVSFQVDSVISELGLVETADTLSENRYVTCRFRWTV